MALNYDIIIIGAGIVGAACAFECVRAGGVRVAVIEPRVVGSGATAAGMGHIVAMDDSPAQLALTRYSQILWRNLAPHLPPDCEFTASGTLWVAADDAEMDEVRRKAALYAQAGIPTEVLTAQQLAEAEPHLRRGLTGALRVPQDGVVYPPCVARFLLEQARCLGADVLLGRTVRAVTDNGVLLDDGTNLSAGAVVNATGQWAAEVTPGLPVKKRKGHLVITDRYPQWVRHQLIELGYLKNAHALTADSVAFNVQPRATGQLLIGSSRQYGAEGAEVETPVLQAMLRRATEYMPDLAKISAVRVWTGFRAATPDHLPIIGRVGDSALYLATGHEGLGVTTSLGTAQLIADMIVGRATAIDARPYHPNRFAVPVSKVGGESKV